MTTIARQFERKEEQARHIAVLGKWHENGMLTVMFAKSTSGLPDHALASFRFIGALQRALA
jgi:hypothetical protein